MMNREGKFVPERPHYAEKENVIRLDDSRDNGEYEMAFCHEYGHFIDAQMGRPSMSEAFRQALEADLVWYGHDSRMGVENFSRMLRELEESEALDSVYVSDLLSGLFRNDVRLRACYEENGAAFYHHSDGYWSGSSGPAKAVEREAFANLFGIYVENHPGILSFVEKNLPNLTARFKKIMGGSV